MTIKLTDNITVVGAISADAITISGQDLNAVISANAVDLSNLTEDIITTGIISGSAFYGDGSSLSGVGTDFPLLAPDGSNTAPSYSFTSSTNSGLYWDISSGRMTLVEDGTDVFYTVNGSSLEIANDLFVYSAELAGNVFQVQRANEADPFLTVEGDGFIGLTDGNGYSSGNIGLKGTGSSLDIYSGGNVIGEFNDDGLLLNTLILGDNGEPTGRSGEAIIWFDSGNNELKVNYDNGGFNPLGGGGGGGDAVDVLDLNGFSSGNEPSFNGSAGIYFNSDDQAFYKDVGGGWEPLAGGSFGSEFEIPYSNSNGDDYDFDSGFYYDSNNGELYAGGNLVVTDSVSYGSENEIPFSNDSGDGFNYSSNLSYDDNSGELTVNGNIVLVEGSDGTSLDYSSLSDGDFLYVDGSSLGTGNPLQLVGGVVTTDNFAINNSGVLEIQTGSKLQFQDNANAILGEGAVLSCGGVSGEVSIQEGFRFPTETTFSPLFEYGYFMATTNGETVPSNFDGIGETSFIGEHVYENNITDGTPTSIISFDSGSKVGSMSVIVTIYDAVNNSVRTAHILACWNDTATDIQYSETTTLQVGTTADAIDITFVKGTGTAIDMFATRSSGTATYTVKAKATRL